MRYDTITDMFLDNRRGLEDDIKHLSEEDKERVLSAFDWAVFQTLEMKIAYNIFKEELIKKSGKEFVGELEKASCERFMEIGKARDKYLEDVESGKRVGYSAEREQVEQED
jgi:hypothetical protein